MAKRILIDALHPEETRVIIADENQIYDFDFVSTAKKQLKGNIYLAKITRVEPSLQAAFVEYGGGKQGFLPFAEIHTDYYQIPVSDRKRLMEEAERENAAEDAALAAGKTLPTTEAEANAEQANETANENGATSTDFDTETLAEQQNTEISTDSTESEQARPAYLMQGAIDISLSEDVPMLLDEQSVIEGEFTTLETPHTETPLAEGITTETPDAVQSIEGAAAPETGEEHVETLTSEEEEIEARPKRNPFLRRYKIQEVIRRGQIVLVQVIKEERGNKGCSLTTYLSLAGRYCVLMPNSPKDGGISRKIASAEDRKRLKALSTEFRLAEGMSVIIRTAGMDRTRAEIKRDFDYLVKLWNAIREDTLRSNAPALIYEESDIIKRAIRDQYSNDIEELVIEGESGYKAAREFMKLLLPSHLPKVKLYNAPTPLFYAYNIEDQLLSMHDPVVKLKSGGYIVINPTEALISVDVNSGRATGERNIEETASKTNLEAAAEVARQLRLRDLAGLIVIDFIDMLESRNRRAVEKMLKDSLKADRAKIQLGRISPFGLLEMSRQRLRPSISETNMVQCPHCIGRGVIRSNESMSIQMIRSIEKEASNGNVSSLRVVAPQNIALHMLNYKRDALRALEERYNVSIQIVINLDLTASEFNIEKIRRSQSERGESSDNRRPPRDRNDRPQRDRNERPRLVETVSADIGAADEASNDNDGNNITEVSSHDGSEARNERGDRNRRPRRRRGGRDRDDREPRPQNITTSAELNNAPAEGESAESVEPAEAGGDRPSGNRPPRTRGGRGRRKWRDRPERAAGEDQATIIDAPTRWDGGASALASTASLPAFATDNRPAAEPASPAYKPFHDHQPAPVENAANAAPAQPKRGWWQKMISLDE